MGIGRRGRHKRHFQDRTSRFWRNKDFSFNLCPQIGWGQPEEAKVVSSCNRTLERKITAQHRLERKNYRIFFHENFSSSEALEEMPAS